MKEENVQEKEQKATMPEYDENGKKIPFFKRAITFIKTHEDIRQMLLFTFFGFCCAMSQLLVSTILKYGLETIEKLGTNHPFEWFIFSHRSTGDFIGFLVGSFVGQVLTFILNRKKTFKATNNVVISAIMYTIMAVGIVLMQTYIGGVVTVACENAYVKSQGVPSDGVVNFLITMTGLAVGGMLAWIISFVGNKYLVMRNWGKSKK